MYAQPLPSVQQPRPVAVAQNCIVPLLSVESSVMHYLKEFVSLFVIIPLILMEVNGQERR